MEEGRRNLTVGIFVLCGLLALAILIVQFGRGPTWLMQGSTYPIHVRFPEVSGIRAGNLVTAMGIKIGSVDSVELLTPSERAESAPATPGSKEQRLVSQGAGVDVVLAIDKRYLIPAGSSAQAVEPMLGQGRPPVEIIPGPSGAPPLAAGASIEGKIRRAIESIFPSGVVNTFQTTARQIGDAAEALTPVLDEMKGLLEKRSPFAVDQPGGPQGNFSSAVARLDASLKHFNEVLGDEKVKSQLRLTVSNVEEMSERGKKVMTDLENAAGQAKDVMTDARQFIGKADQALANVDGRVNELSRGLMETLDRADRFMDYLNTIGQQITSGQGNLGQLVMDSKLYEAMTTTAERLSLAVEEFRALIAEWRQGKIKVAL
jgi:ABC-type transporter Mla subunit MlaD